MIWFHLFFFVVMSLLEINSSLVELLEIIEHLPSKHAAWSSNPNTAKKRGRNVFFDLPQGYIKYIMAIQNLANKI
jgi:hypothetical protein